MKNKKKIVIIIFSILIALIAMITLIPFGNEQVQAEGTYQITTQEQLKEWLLNTNNVQTNNPNAQLANNITLDWGNVSAYPSNVDKGATLDGNNHTVSLAGFTGTTPGDIMYAQIGLFTNFVCGTLKNTNFELLGDYNITIHEDTAARNEDLFVGVICGKLEQGTIDNCSVYVDHNIYFTTGTKLTNWTDATSNHFGLVAGGMWGNAVISNTKSVLTSNATISLYTKQAYAFVRGSMITSDPYSDTTGTPTIKNVYIERAGNFVLSNRSTSAGGEIYGEVVADLDTGGSGGDHNVVIDGVIYNNKISGNINAGISYEHKRERSDNKFGYFIGAVKSSGTNYSISNIYSLVNLNDITYVTSMGNGYMLLPAGYEYGFNTGDKLTITTSVQDNFIWDIKRNSSGENLLPDIHKLISASVAVDKISVDATLQQDSLVINNGIIKREATFGFASNETVYSGVENKAIFTIDNQVITEGFSVDYQTDNINAYTTSHTEAKCDLVYPDTENGIFLYATRYYVPRDEIDFANATMQILPAPLTINYTEGNIYTNNLLIEGLVNGETITINNNKYGNGNYCFDCDDSTQKTITFVDTITKTNYDITTNISDEQFEVSAFTIAIDNGLTITNTDGIFANVEDNNLYIYNKLYNQIIVSFNQEEGWYNRVDVLTDSDKEYNFANSLSETTMTTVITPKTENDFQYINELFYNKSLRKVAVKIEIDDKTKVQDITINTNEDVVIFGDYYVYVTNWGESVTINIIATENVKFYVNNVEQTTEENTLTIANVTGNDNNIIDVKIQFIQ